MGIVGARKRQEKTCWWNCLFRKPGDPIKDAASIKRIPVSPLPDLKLHTMNLVSSF